MLTSKEAKIKQKWINALRSGKYKQTTGVMYDADTKGFCCLGVLQHVLLGGKVETWRKNGVNTFRKVPTDEFYIRFGLEWVKQKESWLADLNDYEGWSFEQIAGEIDRQWV